MNPITYLCFTLMSILIQFCLMDITSIGTDITSIGTNIRRSAIDMNRTHKKGDLNDMIKRITQKPHALYYRTEAHETKKANVKSMYPNSSITKSAFSTTDLISTELDLFYEDKNTTIDSAFTTETFLTSTEFDNVTEITFLYKTSTVKPVREEKTTRKEEKCPCDLLYQMCDINCCCDIDCTDKEILFFKTCGGNGASNTQLRSITNNECSNDFIGNMFCIVKTNLPDQRDIRSEADASVINKVYKWHNIEKLKSSTDTKKTLYSTGDPVLVLKGGKLQNIDLPIPSINNYCKGKKPIRFLVNEAIKCNVKLKDLHAMHVLKIANETNIVTYTNDNSTSLNCSTLLCANWSVLVCDKEDCKSYNQELHDPICSEASCSNIPHKIEYIFYCNETGIIRSTVRLHVKYVSTMLQLIQQDIHVSFYMTSNSNRIIQYSGNPGYIHGLPIIASNEESNHTYHFYNNTEEDYNHILLPYNENGICVLNGMMNNKIQFGRNKILNCRLILARTKFKNASEACTKIQERIYTFLHLDGDIFISQFGKPVAGQDWVLLEKSKNFIYGEYLAKDSKLLCHNIITSLSFTIVYIDNGRTAMENKITSASVVGSPKNLTLYSEQKYVVISVDVKFIDASGPAVHVYAGAPVLRIHLPKNFFLPFH